MPKGFIKNRPIVFGFFWALVSLAGIPSAPAQDGPVNPEALILKYKPVLAPKTFKAFLQLELERSGKPARHYQLALWQKNPGLVRLLFEAPASEKGKILLKKNEEYFLALPDLGEVIRLPPSQISDWGFFYAENLFPFYFHKDLDWGPVEHKGDQWTIAIKRKSDPALWISCALTGPDGPLNRVSLFDPSGKKIRTISVEWEGAPPNERPKRMEVENVFPEPYRARIRIENLRLKPVFPAQAFEIDLLGTTEK
jgi:outer membrane lipoprotein-sorting protein